MQIRHLAGLICKTLDIALTPKTIKSGFRATGIVPFDADIFSDNDFVKAVETGENDIQLHTLSTQAVGQAKDVVEPEPSTSSVTHSITPGSKLLNEIGPLRGITPMKSNRGRKPMQSAVLTSPEILQNLKIKAEEKKIRETKQGSSVSKKRGRPAKATSAKKLKKAAQ